jgi:hypothetical protein
LKFLEQQLELSAEEYRLRYYPDWRMLLLMALEQLQENSLTARDYALLSRFLFR